MKALITKLNSKASSYADEDAVGEVHLIGAIDTFACGLVDEDYDSKATTKPLTCATCITMLNWAKKVSKIRA